MKNIDYKTFRKCRFCNSIKLETVINLGSIALAGGFLKTKKQFENEKKYPVEVNFCKNCYLLQLRTSINPDMLFKNYFYFSSSIKTLVNHFRDNAEHFSNFLKNKDAFIVEIGSNDGAFLSEMKKKNFKVLGIDPSVNVSLKARKKGIPVIIDFFNHITARKIIEKNGKADLIFSSNTLAHIENIHSVFQGISELINEKGILIFEVHYLPKLIKDLQYDMIYHEHQYYYSLLTLRKFLRNFGLKIFDAKEIPIHGGSIQVYVTKISTYYKTTKRLANLIKKEKQEGIDKIQTYRKFDEKIEDTKKQLLELIGEIKSQGGSVAGYGASGRGTVLSNYTGLNKNIMEYVIDDAPSKIGFYTPGTHQKIVSSQILNTKKRPDYTILFAWSFLNEIKSKSKKYLKSGGKFIIPLPNVRVITK